MSLNAISARLRKIVGPENVLTETEVRSGYADGSLDQNRISTSRWKVGTRYGAVSIPDLVVMPSSTEEVAKIVKLCNGLKVPLIPVSGGSNLVGATVPVDGGVMVDMRRMNKVLKIDPGNLYAICQPAVTLANLQVELRGHGLCHGTNPGSSDWATVGGAVALGAQAMTGFKYGTVAENLLALEVVMPDGSVVDTGPWYGSGYNLRGLFVRSEGTLGIITRVTMKVHRLPPRRVDIGFLFDSFERAVDAQLELASLELGPVTTSLASKSFARDHEALADVDAERRFRGWLIIELDGDASEISAAKRAINRLVKTRGGEAIKQRQMDSIGGALALFTSGARKSALPPAKAGGKVRVSRHLWLPPDKIVETYRAFEELARKHGLDDPTALNTPTRLIVGVLVAPGDREDLAALGLFLKGLGAVVKREGGTLFGAHGVGLANKEEIEEDYGEGTMELMRRVKRAVDPNNIMNPGKMLDSA